MDPSSMPSLPSKKGGPSSGKLAEILDAKRKEGINLPMTREDRAIILDPMEEFLTELFGGNLDSEGRNDKRKFEKVYNIPELAENPDYVLPELLRNIAAIGSTPLKKKTKYIPYTIYVGVYFRKSKMEIPNGGDSPITNRCVFNIGPKEVYSMYRIGSKRRNHVRDALYVEDSITITDPSELKTHNLVVKPDPKVKVPSFVPGGINVGRNMNKSGFKIRPAKYRRITIVVDYMAVEAIPENVARALKIVEESAKSDDSDDILMKSVKAEAAKGKSSVDDGEDGENSDDLLMELVKSKAKGGDKIDIGSSDVPAPVPSSD